MVYLIYYIDVDGLYSQHKYLSQVLQANLKHVCFQNDLVVETSLVGVVLNGLSHLSHVRNKAHFAMCLIRGLGGNLHESSRENFAKEVSF